jgi:hypothetical protein
MSTATTVTGPIVIAVPMPATNLSVETALYGTTWKSVTIVTKPTMMAVPTDARSPPVETVLSKAVKNVTTGISPIATAA